MAPRRAEPGWCLGIDGTAHPLLPSARTCARWLGRHGIDATSRVLVREANSVDVAILLLALTLKGCSIALLDDRCATSTVMSAIADADIDIAVGTFSPTENASLGLSYAGTSDVLVRRALDLNDADRRERRDLADLSLTQEEIQSWTTRDDALVMWTSGSSGAPKGLVRSGRSMLRNILATAEAMDYRSDDVLLPLLPMTHQYGLSLLLLAAHTGAGLIIGSPRRGRQTIRRGLDLGATVVDATPPTYSDILAEVRDHPHRERVRLWCAGGAPLPGSLRTAYAGITRRPLLDGYGMTEAGNIAVATLMEPQGLGHPIPGVRVRIVDEDGQPAAPGAIGSVQIDSPDLFSRSLAGEAPHLTPDGWFDVGDIGRLDEGGRLHVVGRRHAVHRGGNTIYPNALMAAADAAGVPVHVVGVDDERLGSHITAFVCDPEGAPSSVWRARLRSCWAEVEWPNAVTVVRAFPRTPSGKVDAHALSQRAERDRRAAESRRLVRPESSVVGSSDVGSSDEAATLAA